MSSYQRRPVITLALLRVTFANGTSMMVWPALLSPIMEKNSPLSQEPPSRMELIRISEVPLGIA